ncbi:bifunctional transcriptional activator/DNA repair enzyme Ada isoform X2 [Polyergus mexicanus]|uniref:bifunctional transcriptional activator/DNA repair enzyme Ada isoform X1 n=1 Tax=Polyergus mexicanus TaxID=615972 RepID=UPI0038B4711B
MVLFRSITIDEYKNKYTTFQQLYAFHQTPFGKCLIAITDTDEDVIYLGFVDEDESKALEVLKQKWPKTKTLKDTENKTKTVIEKIFHPDTSHLHSIRVLMKGTKFQIKVWRSLISIPKETITTYEKIAQTIDNPKAAIAVGSATSKNYIAYIVPCHRVKGKNGSNKYAWGIERKEAILEYESQNI